jgi:pimeloyl-ACP methyl ester carboxylesterase
VPTIELSAGPVDYEDTGGAGPVLVLVHGLLMDSSLWHGVVAELAAEHRCIVPTLPLGAHREPMRPGADLSVRGIAGLLTELIEGLGLRDVVLVGNDTGGALVQLVMAAGGPNVGRAVLVSCDAFDNYPPRLTGKAVVLSGKLPPALFGLFMQQLRMRPVRRLPIAFGWLTKRGDAATVPWLRPALTRPAIRQELVRTLRSVRAEPDLLVRAAERLPMFDRPVLVVWAAEDRVMPLAHGHRLTELLPDARLVEVDDSYTLVPLDQPARLAALIAEFCRAGRGFEHERPRRAAGEP